MHTIVYGQGDFAAQMRKLYDRPAFPKAAEDSAAAIIAAVAERGDAALSEFAEKFDHVKLAPSEFLLPLEEAQEIAARLPASDRRAIRTALKQVREFARLTKPRNWRRTVRPGVVLGEKFTPVERVGVYIPGGTAPLVSTVIHTAGIASACGVPEIVAATPPGNMHPAVLYAMLQCGVKEIYRLGGVYAVAALALGTPCVRPVKKICGPGNAYVTAAKKLLYGKVGIDLVAGPSEVLIVADGSAEPVFVAADLLSQAEHGSGLEQAVLVSDSAEIIAGVKAELLRQRETLKRRSAVDRVLENGLFLIQVPDLKTAAQVAGDYAPEHMELQVAQPEKLLPLIKYAGAIFLGPWTPEPIGDFCAGPSHVLPTAGSAKMFNGLESVSFFSRSSIIKYSREALKREAPTAAAFGAMEQLDAHGRAGTMRFCSDKAGER